MDTPAAAKPSRPTAPRRRLIRAGKWAGVVACVLIAASLTFSLTGDIEWRDSRGGVTGLGAGGIGKNWLRPEYAANNVWRSKWELNWKAARPRWRPLWISQWVFQGIWVPLWLPLLVLVLPTSWLWYRDSRLARRRFKGLCVKCGYDRAGLAPASACPECNAPAPTDALTAQ